MDERRSIFEDRVIEFDGLAITMLACAFIGVSGLTVWAVSSAANSFYPPMIAVGAIVGAAVIAAWIFGYPRRAALPSIALVVLIAMMVLPSLSQVDGPFLQEAAGAASSRLYVAMALYISGLGFFFLAFMLFGFFVPLVGAVLALRRGEKGARGTLILHCVLTFTALALVFFGRASP